MRSVVPMPPSAIRLARSWPPLAATRGLWCSASRSREHSKKQPITYHIRRCRSAIVFSRSYRHEPLRPALHRSSRPIRRTDARTGGLKGCTDLANEAAGLESAAGIRLTDRALRPVNRNDPQALAALDRGLRDG